MSIASAITDGQVAMGFQQLIRQVSAGKKLITEGRPAITTGPAQAVELLPADVQRILGTDFAKLSAACDAFQAALE